MGFGGGGGGGGCGGEKDAGESPLRRNGRERGRWGHAGIRCLCCAAFYALLHLCGRGGESDLMIQCASLFRGGGCYTRRIGVRRRCVMATLARSLAWIPSSAPDHTPLPSHASTPWSFQAVTATVLLRRHAQHSQPSPAQPGPAQPCVPACLPPSPSSSLVANRTTVGTWRNLAHCPPVSLARAAPLLLAMIAAACSSLLHVYSDASIAEATKQCESSARGPGRSPLL